jgi:hypothetical protein
MRKFLLILFPILCMVIWKLYGWEAIQQQRFFPIVGISFGLAALAQGFLKMDLSGGKSYSMIDLSLLGLGLFAAVSYPFAAAVYFFYFR